jgi:hypothetical protein
MRRVKIWEPKTDSERDLVQDELNAILASSHFSNSKRYPAFLRYVVEKTLDGKKDHLKERTIGVEVFGRPPDYDTNADPVVRVSAAEVRKRIAQYYHEAAGEPDIQIDLPTGSYVSVLRKKALPTKPELDQQRGPPPVGAVDHKELPFVPEPVQPIELTGGRLSRSLPKAILRLPRRAFVFSVCILIAITGLGVFFAYRASPARQLKQLWAPLVQTQDPVLIVIGSGKPWLISPESPETSLSDHMIGPYHHVSVPDTVAVSRLANILQQDNRSYFIKEASSTSMADLRERSVILVGALNNAWTLQLNNPLRFRFVPGMLARIQDTKNPQNSAWMVDYSKPYSSLSVDYGIDARYHDSYTNGNILIVAGIGPYGTEAASELVSSPQYLRQIEHLVPGGFSNPNLEMVIKTDVTRGEAGPPQLVSAYAF